MIFPKLRCYIIFIILFSFIEGASAQNNSGVKATVTTQEGVSIGEATVTMEAAEIITSTDALGQFQIYDLQPGSYSIEIYAPGYEEKTVEFVLGDDQYVILPNIILLEDDNTTIESFEERVPSININNAVSDEENGIAGAVSGILSASRDAFVNMASYNFGPLRFRIRGYGSDQTQVLINNIPMNDAITGNTIWSQWGGLNDVFRSRSSDLGLFPSEYSFGGLYGASLIDASASNQRKQTRITYSATNRSYRNRLMLTHSTGLMSNGWAFSVSASMRWSDSGYMPGTRYYGNSYFFAADKKINDKHKIGLITFGSPTIYGKIAPVVGEIYDIADKYYNPNWGYQNGVVRNAKERYTFMPTTILNYTYTPNSKSILYVGLSNQSGIHRNSTLDWYNAPDPRPDYYRYLPSFQTDSLLNATTTNELKNNPDKLQIDWDRLYNVNYAAQDTLRDAAGNIVRTGLWSKYVQGAFVENKNKWTFNSTFNSQINDHFTFNSGFMFQHQNTDNYKEILDLMGGEFFVNLNQFANRDYPSDNKVIQYDLENPNRTVGVGDKYNYYYRSLVQNIDLWGQAKFSYDHWDFFLAGKLSTTSYQRDGYYQNGLFADNSKGKSDRVSFFSPDIKGGITYKVNGRNYIYANGELGAEAPTFQNVFISPQMNNYTIKDPKNQQISSAEVGYIYRAPSLKASLNGYVSDFKDVVEIIRFYNDDENAFVNYVQENMNFRNIGMEFGLEAKINSSWSVTSAVALGQSFYTNNPSVTIYNQNDTTASPLTSSGKTVYFNNYNTGRGPQTALGLGLRYSSKNYWFATLNANYLDDNYISLSPERHTAEAVDGYAMDSYERNFILSQEKLPSAFTMDFFGGKSFIIKRNKETHHNTFMYIYVGVNNIFNNTNIFTGGFEQRRLNKENLAVFGNKYFRAYGTNYFISLSFSL